MAILTPAQKPRGLAKSIFMGIPVDVFNERETQWISARQTQSKRPLGFVGGNSGIFEKNHNGL
jgi:hypothetical protein